MTDVSTKEKRSQVMSRIRGSGNKGTELGLIKLFRFHKIACWRRKQNIFGKPDFVFSEFKVAIFVDGCFWHGCPKHSVQPKSNTVFWKKKLSMNVKRDKLVNRELRKLGWCVIRIWEHDIKKRPQVCVRRIQTALSSQLKKGIRFADSFSDLP